MGEVDSDNPGLWFTGFKPTFTGYFDAAGISANRIASSIAANAARTHATESFGLPSDRDTIQSITLPDTNLH
jgi:hypothetical protein